MPYIIIGFFCVFIYKVNAEITLPLKWYKEVGWSLSPDLFNDFKNLFNVKTFVESGTYLGETALKAARYFDAVHTVELSPMLYSEFKKKARVLQNVIAYYGNSADVFPVFLSRLSGSNILFWLDGHYSAGNTAFSKNPLIAELNAIRDSSIKNSVILIDDIRSCGHYLEKNWPNLRQVCHAIREISGDYEIVIMGDILLAYLAENQIVPSAVLKACTISRMSEEFSDLYAVKDVISAEKIIARARDLELDAISKLYTSFGEESPYYKLWYALILKEKGNYKDALTIFTTVENQLSWRVAWYIAECQYSLGNNSKALFYLDIVNKNDCNFIEAKNLLLKLKNVQ